MLVVAALGCAAEAPSNRPDDDVPDPMGGAGGSRTGGRTGQAGSSGPAGGSAGSPAGGASGSGAVDARPPGDAPAAGSGGGTDAAVIPLPPPPPTMPGSAFPPVAATATVVISEIMYHPVKEEADVENHEWVEIFNRTMSPVSLKGWRLESSGKNAVSFTFPDVMLMPGEYKVIARNRKALATDTKWGLTEAALLGDYTGELDNGGTTLVLKNASGAIVDGVKYDDEMPWPLAADSLGVGEDWLPTADRPITKHQYMGRSLERISTEIFSSEPANWEASPLDLATPGKVNSVKGDPQPLAVSVEAIPMGGQGRIIKKADSAQIRVRFSNPGTVEDVRLRFFDDDLIKRDEVPAFMPMTAGADRTWTITLPPKADNTLVRFQIWAKRAGKDGQVSPRVTDPLLWHSYFVTPDVKSTSRTYHLFVHPEDWSKLELWLSQGRASGCTANPNWDTEVPATFVFDGQVYDVRVRYTGSRYQRRNGFNMPSTWNYPKPTFPAGRTFKALSWRVKFPRYAIFEGYPSVNLNKMFQGCPGTNTFVESKLLEKAGLPSYLVRFARLHINGGYYHYTMQPESIGPEMMTRYLKDGEVLGDLYKSDGPGGDEAAAKRSDFKPIANDPNYCAGRYSVLDRYKASYTRETYEHRSWDNLIKLITDLDAAQRTGKVSAAVKDYFTKNWDLDALAKSFVIRNWSGVWDDTFHNFFPYQQPNGKWIIIQQDFEWDFGLGQFGGERGLSLWRSDMTPYLGAYEGMPIGQTCEVTPRPIDTAEGRRCNALGFSRLKDLFIQNYRDKIDATFKQLGGTILKTEEVLKVIDEAAGQFNLEDWNSAPADKGYCQPPKLMDHMRQWTRERNTYLGTKIGM